MPARIESNRTAKSLFEAHGFHAEKEEEKAHNEKVFENFVVTKRPS
jgi:hypothetical protein